MIRRLIAVVIALAILWIGVDLAERSRRSADLTADRALSLSAETKDVVRALRRDTRITAFVARSDPGRAQASSLLSRYRRESSRITVRLLDPRESPGEATRLGIDRVLGGVAVAAGDRVERATTLSEQDVTAAVARVVRDRTPTACITAGHGEADVTTQTEEGFSVAAGLLQQNGYRVTAADLLVSPQLPPNCDVVILASPTAPLGAAEQTLANYLAGGGRMLVMADPQSTVDLTPLVQPYGMAIEKGLVFEGDEASRLPGDPLTVAITQYRSTSSLVRRLPPTLFSHVQAVVVDEEPTESGLFATAILRTTELSYLKRDPAAVVFDPERDVRGPITIGGVADLSENIGGSVRRTRVAVFGDVDFASNALVSEAGNGRLLMQAADWLTIDEDLVSVSANLARVRPLALTESRARYARFLSAAMVPALFVLIGAMVWAVRRGR